jgi:uncharacterized protein (TIGR03437 family)
MKIKHSSVLFLTLLGATAGYPQITLNTIPARAIGAPSPPPKSCGSPQLVPKSGNPNLVEGRELYSPQGIAVDNSTSPPMVYVADTGNNRVLAWKNAASFSNGAMADLVIGQPDLCSTFPLGPSTTYPSDLAAPTGLAVYKSDLYVVDSGNNRVLRYPNPFSPTGQKPPDLYIGQPSLNSGVPDQPNTLVSAQGIYTASTSAFFVANIAFDSAGNLWMTDPGNRRVLRFPAAAIAKGGGGLTADMVIGQLDFLSPLPGVPQTNPSSPTYLNQFAVPVGIAFDQAGNLYVSDNWSTQSASPPGRVLVFQPPFATGMNATRLMGVFSATATTVPAQSVQDKVLMYDPQSIVVLPNNLGVAVADTQSNRVLIFPPITLWDQNTSNPPQATSIMGQANSCAAYPSQACRAANNGSPSPSASTLAYPSAVAVILASGDLLVADSGNNRVIGMPQQAGAYTSANRVLGQDYMNTFSINLIEGKEFAFTAQSSQGLLADAGLAIDSTGDTPHLYVADPYNNRVLGFKDARKLTPGDATINNPVAGFKADIVIGQPDMHTALCNYPTGNTNQPGQSNLCRPIGLLVDSGGNLYVADSGNGRVLRFPTPFAQQSSSLQPADRVVGQAGFYSKVTDPSPATMASPYGLALSGVNGLLVSDVQLNRVLYFPMANGDLTSPQGEAATKVFGQTDFNVVGKPTVIDDTVMTAPRHVTADSSGRLYVADTVNNRVMIFGDPHDVNTASKGAHALFTITAGLSAPRGIFVSLLTGEIWVADTGNGRSLRYPSFEQYLVTNNYNFSISGYYSAPLALAQDQYGDLMVADAYNRVEFYYPGLAWQNAGSYVTNFLAPGVLATIYPLGVTYGTNTANSNQQPNPVPYPTLLADTQVLFNGQPAPLLLVSPLQINFMIPMSAPTTGTADVQVVRQSTGQILTDGPVAMNTVSPAVFAGGPVNCSLPGGKCRQAAVVNAADGTVNSPSNPAAAGSYISIYATGQGFVQGAPPDGDIPRAGLVQTSALPKVFINACYVDDASCTGETGVENVQFSGLSPQFPGVWQINVRIPKNTGPGAQVALVVVMNNYTSQTALTANYYTTIAVKNQ